MDFQGPPMSISLAVLGREESLRRVKEGIEVLREGREEVTKGEGYIGRAGQFL